MRIPYSGCMFTLKLAVLFWITLFHCLFRTAVKISLKEINNSIRFKFRLEHTCKYHHKESSKSLYSPLEKSLQLS